jgi:hypothetical protein
VKNPTKVMAIANISTTVGLRRVTSHPLTASSSKIIVKKKQIAKISPSKLV